MEDLYEFLFWRRINLIPYQYVSDSLLRTEERKLLVFELLVGQQKAIQDCFIIISHFMGLMITWFIILYWWKAAEKNTNDSMTENRNHQSSPCFPIISHMADFMSLDPYYFNKKYFNIFLLVLIDLHSFWYNWKQELPQHLHSDLHNLQHHKLLKVYVYFSFSVSHFTASSLFAAPFYCPLENVIKSSRASNNFLHSFLRQHVLFNQDTAEEASEHQACCSCTWFHRMSARESIRPNLKHALEIRATTFKLRPVCLCDLLCELWIKGLGVQNTLASQQQRALLKKTDSSAKRPE